MLLNIDDFKKKARKRVPKLFFEYADSGSWTQSTYRENEADFEKLKFVPRVLVDMANRTLETNIIGQKFSMPVGLAPVGMTGMQHADGEILAAQAAEEFGIPFTLSTMSICSLEAVAEKTSRPFWFQLYVMRDRKFVEALIERAKAVNCSALVLTLDLQILGQRHKDIRNGLSAPPKFNMKHIWQVGSRPLWCLQMLATKNRSFGNIIGHATGISDMSSLSSWTTQQFDPSLSWEDVTWIKKRWGGPLILKGIMDKGDALKAAKTGADAIIVSNHGGRQLDGAPSSISVLPEIVDSVGKHIEVHLDSGVRSGQDILRAKALGATATYIGRPYIYGLGVAGKKGVTKVLEILRNELDITMAHCGKRDINEVNRSILYGGSL
ncbi:alpha-hydroxy acid oxidase [Flexibacterium corallicola]|uniref:alpha-hydroxy acid oxidase n=1 Tax=Flexibacterium corallicola TaxID=3037259 RepID=UPI00286F5F0C|nr:alpha-hydroxy acid oxidase [Pseudovibrio sp. M1P-2-3]